MVVSPYPASDLSKNRLPMVLGDGPFSIVQAYERRLNDLLISDGFLFGL